MEKRKSLIIYYSFEGSTKLIAETLAAELKSDLLELKPEKEIGSKGFMKYVWGGRQVVLKKQPKLKKFDKDPAEYGLILIGTPVWAFTYSPPIRSFLAQAKLKGKKVAFFCTHEGGKGKTLENLKSELSENRCIGQMDFLNVKKDTENNIKKAQEWAKKL